MSSTLRTLLFAASASQVAASCAYGTHLSPRAVPGAPVPIATFGYNGDISPANWHSLNITTNSACAIGTNQSPIDVVEGVYSSVPGSQYKIDVTSFPTGATFENLGSTVEVIGEGGSLILPGGNKTFNFAQFHFHTPSEHLDNGTGHVMEMHMVFQAEDLEIAVVGTYIDIGTTQGELDVMLETLFESVGAITNPGTATTTAPLDLTPVLSMLSATTFKTYSGSLTTPPCSEGVNWNVATDRLMVSVATFKAARDVMGYNARFTQNFPGQDNILSLAAVGVSEINNARVTV
ncbi:unnamed protein product [Discula destructiva]